MNQMTAGGNLGCGYSKPSRCQVCVLVAVSDSPPRHLHLSPIYYAAKKIIISDPIPNFSLFKYITNNFIFFNVRISHNVDFFRLVADSSEFDLEYAHFDICIILHDDRRNYF